MTTAEEAVAGLLAEFDRRLKALERAPRLKNASVHDAVIPVYDADFSLRQTVGRQPDGTYTVVDSNGPPPPVPSEPVLEERPGTLVVTWDGLFADGVTAPADWDHVEVHVSVDSGYTPTDATQVATFNTLKGGSVTLALDPVPQYVVLQAVSTSRTESAPTGEVEGTPLPPTTAGGVQTFLEDEPPVGLDADDDGALWYDTNDSNHPYRWDGGTLAWVSIRDGSIAAASAAAATAQTQANTALTAAQAAQATADGSIRTFYQSAAPWANGSSQPPEVVGDLWFDTDDGQAYRWNGATWVIIEDNSIAAALAAAQNAQTTADGKITSYYQTTQPTIGEVGDLWFDTNDNNHPYFCDTAAVPGPIHWTDLRDGTIADAQDTADAALDAATTDGLAPSASPDPTMLSGIESMIARWTPITNADPVTYDVHVSTTLGFTPDYNPATTTLVGSTTGSQFVIRALPGPEPDPGTTDPRTLQYDAAYFIRIVARDADGSAAPSAQGVGSVFQVTGVNLAADSVTALNIVTGSLTGELFAASVIIGGTFKSAETGQRVEWGSLGIQGYRSDGTLILNIPTDGSNALFDGEFIIRGATILGGISVQSDENESTADSVWTLMRGITSPSATPQIAVTWDTLRPSTSTLTTAQKTGPDLGTFDLDPAAVSHIEWKPGSGGYWVIHQIRSGLGTRGWFFHADGTPFDILGTGVYFTDQKEWETWSTVEIYTGAKAGVYSLFRFLSGAGTDWYINGPVGFNKYTRTNTSGVPALGTNGTDLFVAEVVNGDNIRINYHSMQSYAAGAPIPNLPAASTTYQSTSGYAASLCAVVYNSTGSGGFDVTGTVHNRYATAERGVAYSARLIQQSGTGSGALTPGGSGGWAASNANIESWESPTTNRRGMDWDGANFWTYGGDGLLYKHTGERWDPAATSSTVWAQVTFKDTDAGGTGTHETKPGLFKSFAYKRRAKIRFTPPSIPDNGGVDDPNAVQLYMARKATTPTNAEMWAQGSPATAVFDLTTLATTGTNPPTTNTFPAANAAKFTNDDGTLIIDGTGLIQGNFKRAGYTVGQIDVYWYGHLQTNTGNTTSGTWTKITPWTLDDGITAVIASASGVFTVSLPGRYRVTAEAGFADNAAGSRGIRVVWNGTPDRFSLYAANPITPTTQAGYAFTSKSKRLTAGQTIEIQTLQNSGTGLLVRGVASGLTYTSVEIEYLGL